jgi:hypothetical protein
VLRVVLDQRRQRQQELALGNEQVALCLWRNEVSERGPENARRLID